MTFKSKLPEEVSKWLDIVSNDKLEWKLDVINNKRIVIISNSSQPTINHR